MSGGSVCGDEWVVAVSAVSSPAAPATTSFDDEAGGGSTVSVTRSVRL